MHNIKLNEFTREDLFKGIDLRTKHNYKHVESPTYLGITKDYKVIFNVPSATTEGIYYKVPIKLVDFEELSRDKSLSTEDIIRLCLLGDVEVSCNCPAMKYWGYSYILTQLGAKDGYKQNKYPIVRNPNLEGTLCKHSYKALKYLGKLWKKIAKDIDTLNFIE